MQIPMTSRRTQSVVSGSVEGEKHRPACSSVCFLAHRTAHIFNNNTGLSAQNTADELSALQRIIHVKTSQA